jgi:transcription antitermination factor NusG
MSFWACARVEPKREAVAQHFLQLRGFESYVPRVRERRLRGGRHVVTLVPLFPCYCFVAVENGWWDARWCVGVVGLIMNRTRPAVVADGIIDAIREREIRGAVELPVLPLRRGDRVRILAGPFRDQLGLYAGMRSRERVEVLLALLGGQQRVTLPRDDIVPL